ncbi:MAG: SPOR domain-containing protein [bacterium]|nr:SPOR domain-containing protein [bacterium]
MAVDRREAEDVREVRLEGRAMLVVGTVLVAALAGAFLAGRWYERRNAPVGGGTGFEGDPLANVVSMGEPVNVDSATTVFDDPSAAGSQAEPEREISKPERRRKPTTEPEPAAPPAAADGAFFVQVFAGRDRGSVERLTDELEQRGFRVKLASQAEGSGMLYRVRVGGYPDRSAADDAARVLKKSGYEGAFVAKVD